MPKYRPAALCTRLALCSVAVAVAVAFAALVPPPAFAAPAVARTSLEASPLRPFTATYAWSWHSIVVAISTVTLQQLPDGNWSYTSAAEPRGIGRLYPMRPRFSSILRVDEQGVQPLRYHAEAGGGSNRNADVVFDWTAGRASGTYEGVTVDLPLKSCGAG